MNSKLSWREAEWEKHRKTGVSEKWHRIGKNKKVPRGTKAGGSKKVKAILLEVECKTSVWL